MQQKPTQMDTTGDTGNWQADSAEVVADVQAWLPPLSLKQNFSWTFVGNGVYQACQWGMLVVLAKLTSPEAVGQFALGLAICAPVVMLTNLQLRAVQATDARGEYEFRDYLGLRLLMTGLALAIITGIAVLGYSSVTTLVILAAGLAKSFQALSDVFYGLLQQHERMDRIAKSMMIKGPLSLVVFGATVYLTHSVLWGFLALAVTWALVLLIYDLGSGALILRASDANPKLNRWQVLRPRWVCGILLRLAWLALPLGLVMMLISLNANIPRYFIERYLGERELGIFAAMAYLMVAGMVIVGALGQSATPRLAKYYAAGNAVGFRNLVMKMVGIGVLLGASGVLLAAVAGRELLTLLYTPEYAQESGVFFWLMIAGGITYVSSFLGYTMTAARYFKVQLPLFALVAGTTTAACLWLVPHWGLLGAAWALIMGAVVQAGGSAGVVLHAIGRVEVKEAGHDASSH